MKLFLLASAFLFSHAAFSAVGGSAITTWNGKQYETEFTYSQIESLSQWDGATFPLPVSGAVALGKAEKWMKEHFPSEEWRLGRLVFADFSHGKKKDLWAWLIGYNNQNHEVTLMKDSGRKYIEQDELVFYVLLDGTLLSPQLKEAN